MRFIFRQAAVLLLPPVLLFAAALAEQSSSVLGDWHTPAGSVIRAEPCGSMVCLRVEELPPDAPASDDIHDPDPALRSRPLCGLVIGRGFTLSNAARATGGTIYDPKTGKTYHGEMTAEGTKLHLRGYIGIPLFGASQTWTRLTSPVEQCRAAGQ